MSILLDLFLTFARIGLFTFGGGYAMISLIDRSCVEKKRWISHDEMMDITVIAESTPGPIAINCATYVGYKQKGLVGAVAATVGIILPSFCVVVFPPPDPALVFKEMRHRVENAASAAVQHDVAAKRLDRPLLFRKSGGFQSVRRGKVVVSDMENDIGVSADGDFPVEDNHAEVVRKFLRGIFLDRGRTSGSGDGKRGEKKSNGIHFTKSPLVNERQQV